jgi:hypothetical protein
MITALGCRRQAVLCMDAAKGEDHVGIRTALLALNRSWITMANQIERLAELRAARQIGEAGAGPWSTRAGPF